MHVVTALGAGEHGLNELAREVGVNTTTLSERLRDLEALGMVRKTTYPTQPPRSVIELLPAGVAFQTVFTELYRWGAAHLKLSADDRTQAETIDVLQGRWAMGLIWALLDGPQRFNELVRTLGGANPTTLRQRVDRLERLGMVKKTTLSLLPPRSTVELTEAGQAMRPVFDALETWAFTYIGAPE